jgi:capsular polysaccharide transport system permease protein
MAMALENWRRSIALSMSAYFQGKFQGSRLGPLLTLSEPVIITLALVVLRLTLREGGIYGRSPMLFVASGVFPYYLFLFVSLRAGAAKLVGRIAVPGRAQLDYFLAVALVEGVVVIGMMFGFFAILWLNGEDAALPHDIGDCTAALLLLFFLGVGIGLINLKIASQFTIWPVIYGVITRGMMFFSGVFVGLYGNYPALLLDREYLVGFTLVAVFLGLVVERASIRMKPL